MDIKERDTKNTPEQKRKTVRKLVKGAYDLQDLRLATGSRLVANFRSKLGIAPDEEVEDGRDPDRDSDRDGDAQRAREARESPVSGSVDEADESTRRVEDSTGDAQRTRETDLTRRTASGRGQTHGSVELVCTREDCGFEAAVGGFSPSRSYRSYRSECPNCGSEVETL